MKRLSVLVAFALFILLSTSSYFVQAKSNQIILDKVAKIEVILVEDSSFCGGSVSLVSPSQLYILSYLPRAGLSRKTIGPFVPGTELVFALVPNPPCSITPLFSSDLNKVVVVRVREDVWGVRWTVDGGGVIMFLRLLEAELPSKRPVIFTHGLGGRPEDWTTGGKRVYFDTLKSDPYNYPEEFLHAYSYSDADGNPDTYDYQGDVTLISQGLEEDVNRLADLYYLGCQKDCVDMVGFSLGGIVARQYLNTHKDNHKVRKLITIGSPHEGVSVLEPENWVAAIPFSGDFLKKALLTLVDTFFLDVFVNLSSEQPISVNSTAAQQLIPSNLFLQSLNDQELIPSTLSYHALCGDIDVHFRQKILFYELERSVSIGDGTVSKASALGIPLDDLERYCFSDEALFEIKISKLGVVYEYVVDPLGFNDLRFRHKELIVQPEVVEKVIDTLSVAL